MQRIDQMKPMTCKGLKWQVLFTFLFSWLCHSVSGQIRYSIAEEMRKDSVIENIAKDIGLDINQLSPRKLRIVSRDSEKYFYVNGDNGNLYVKDRIDREALCEASATCFLTFDAVVEKPFNIFKAKIEIQDINDNPPVFYSETFTIEANELTSPGTRFALQNAEDLDIGVNSVQTYELSDNSHFTLSHKTTSDGFKSPELVLEKSLDQELQNIHELILTALDGGTPVRSGTAVIRIIVTDVNDNFPIFSQEVYKVSRNENSPVNTTIINVNATDKDAGTNGQITYSFSKTSGDVHPSGLFSIHPKSGDINIIKMLDFEKTRNYELSVQAKDGGGLVSHCKVLIEVIDENDNAPEISITSLYSPISEDSAPGTMIALIEVHDKDSEENGHVDCNIFEELPFSLIFSSDSYYRIVTTSNLDRETVSSYNITVLARDRGSPPLCSRTIIRLEILDVNDNPPVFMKSHHVAYVPENNLPGASIYKVQASDPDYGENAKIIYSIYSEKLPVSSYFSVNMENGVLYAQRSFDYEQHKEFTVQLNARDNGSPSLNSNSTLIIRIVDHNDNEPKILYPHPESGGSAVFEMVPFISEPGSLITKVVAVDADVGHNAWLSYHFIQMSELSYFTINEHTGEIRTSRLFQEKDILKHKVVVMVKDNGVPCLSATVTLNLFIADSFQQVAPKISNQINEDPQTNMQLYLVIGLAIISFLFIITVMLVLISKCKQSKPTSLGPLNANLYPTVDPRILSMYSDGTLTLPYSYNVCVALDSCENDFTYVQSKQEVPVENLIDADDSGLGNERGKDTSLNSAIQQSQPNADWQFTQGQRPGPSGTQQPTEESGVWPNNQFETERLQAMILASANEAAEGNSGLVGSTGTMGLSARYGPQFTLQHVPDYRQNIYIPGTTTTLTNAPGKRDNKAPSGNKKKSGKKEKK
ncbi:PREDICTED: protocadherin gamma-B5-like isoform X5 [Nanorana parkeri]|uniref:protocadherin gamma-B5-like isoform X5 n=1 Tax=Nanorana parkeri TaxID=125878 RepID=UPI0008541592|nr:PREDICTED: protocadherin gamma-B5-like isoform X5 [Nanorana parkeri]